MEGTLGATFANLQWGRIQANPYLPSLCVPRNAEAGARAGEAGTLLTCPCSPALFSLRKPVLRAPRSGYRSLKSCSIVFPPEKREEDTPLLRAAGCLCASASCPLFHWASCAPQDSRQCLSSEQLPVNLHLSTNFCHLDFW